jgi:ATP-dependent DNA helicase HFM1/MER3
MTSEDQKSYYDDVSLSADIIESTLPKALCEHICSEITQTVINKIEEAIVWLKSTFFYVRVKKNPAYYGFEEYQDSLLQDLCINTIQSLSDAKIVEYDNIFHTVVALPEAIIMTRNVIKFNTMKLLMSIERNVNLQNLISELSSAEELQITVKRDEKKTLNCFMKQIKYPLKLKVQESNHKVYVLLHSAIDKLNIIDFSMRIDQSEIVINVIRILQALQQLCKERCYGCLLYNSVLLERSLRLRSWNDDNTKIFTQIEGLSQAALKRIQDRGITSTVNIENMKIFQIQEYIGCSLNEAKMIYQV